MAISAPGVSSVTPPELAATNDAAWDLGYMLTGADVWTAVRMEGLRLRQPAR